MPKIKRMIKFHQVQKNKKLCKFLKKEEDQKINSQQTQPPNQHFLKILSGYQNRKNRNQRANQNQKVKKSLFNPLKVKFCKRERMIK